MNKRKITAKSQRTQRIHYAYGTRNTRNSGKSRNRTVKSDKLKVTSKKTNKQVTTQEHRNQRKKEILKQVQDDK